MDIWFTTIIYYHLSNSKIILHFLFKIIRLWLWYYKYFSVNYLAFSVGIWISFKTDRFSTLVEWSSFQPLLCFSVTHHVWLNSSKWVYYIKCHSHNHPFNNKKQSKFLKRQRSKKLKTGLYFHNNMTFHDFTCPLIPAQILQQLLYTG